MDINSFKSRGIILSPSYSTDIPDDDTIYNNSDNEKLNINLIECSECTTSDDKNLEKMHKIESDADVDDDADDINDFYDFKPLKKRKKGIIYISNIPKHMNVTRVREILGEYGQIGRVYLQPEKLTSIKSKKKKKRNPFARHFTEGWIEFESKRVAKQIVPLLNNKQISTSKRSQFYDCLWSMKYLPRFKWAHLTERMNYEEAVHKQRLMTEVSQARKETTFFQNNLDLSEHLQKKAKNATKTKSIKVEKSTKTKDLQ